ncbi:MAG: hypothetical protein M3O09_04680 [Acidobacteriota bacterium]|nr:hypothetical protein [Acidobacteriota bacterium]
MAICTINEIHHLENFRNVPQALREKRANEMEADWTAQYGIQIDGYAPGVITVNIAGSTPEKFMLWLEAAGIVLVTIQARDVLTLWKKADPISLGMCHMLQVDPKVQRFLSDLEPSEIFPKLDELAWNAIRTVPVNPIDAHVSAERMRAANIEIGEDRSNELEPPAPYEPTHDNDLAFGIVEPSADANLFETAKSNNPGLGDWLL